MSSTAEDRIQSDITQCIGHTPLVLLKNISSQTGCRVLAKVESMNPMWSVKDRIGRAMIEAGEKSGEINKETVIIEATSGNTGIALAYVCAAKGYRLKVCMPESMTLERRRLLKALGAELILTPGDKGMPGAVAEAERIASENLNSFLTRQFSNPSNPEIHVRTTAEEIWRDTAGNVDLLVSGVGTGGTISGTSRRLKELNPNLRAVAVEPSASPVISQHRSGQNLQPGKHKIQGIGAGFLPENLDVEILDDVITVSDDDAFESARFLATKEGMFVGISSGAAYWAACQLANNAELHGKTIVVVLPDLGERYLSTTLFPE